MNIITENIELNVGAPSFLYCFYSTIMCNVKDEKKYSHIISFLERGTISYFFCQCCAEELITLKDEFSNYDVSLIVWDMTDKSLTPPWGDNISQHITSLANYFVTADGEDLFDKLIELFKTASQTQSNVIIG